MKKIYITESQWKALVGEDIEQQYGKDAQGAKDKFLPRVNTWSSALKKNIKATDNSPEFDAQFNDNAYDIKHDMMARYKKFINKETGKEDFYVAPLCKVLRGFNYPDGSPIKVYGLGQLNSADINHTIKKDNLEKYDRISKEKKTVPVTWDNNGDDKIKFLEYCAEYMSKALPLIAQREKIVKENIGYVAWPYSHADFNKDFVNQYLQPCLQNEGINCEVIPNVVIKAKEGIKINTDVAKALALDDVDISNLCAFIEEQSTIQTTLTVRHEIDKKLDELAEEIEKNDINQYYQYTTQTSKEEKNNTSTYHTENGMYINNADKRWKNPTKDKLTTVKLQNGNRRDDDKQYRMSQRFYDAAETLKSKKNEIIHYYDEFKEKSNKIFQSDEIELKNGQKINKNAFKRQSKNGETGSMYPELKNNREVKGTSCNFLDKTVDDKGHAKDTDWEIKKMCEAYRRVLYDLFKVNDANKNDNYDKSKALILFDDNVAGGSTLGNVCQILSTGEEGVRWEKIIPVTISFMNITRGSTDADIEKQRMRDAEIVNRREKNANNPDYSDPYAANTTDIVGDNEASYEWLNYDSRNGDTELNDKRINFAKEYHDERRASKPPVVKTKIGRPLGSGKPKPTPVEPIDTTQKRRGRPLGSKNKPKDNQVQTNVQNQSNPLKRHRGRPLGSKNKPKISESLLKSIIRRALTEAVSERSDISEKTPVTVCSLEEFYGICQKLGLSRDVTSNEMAQLVGKKYAFIEVGSGDSRLRAEVNHSVNTFDNDADKWIEGQLYFHNAKNGEIYNVLQLIYDDSQEIDNHLKHKGDKNTYNFDNGNDEFGTTCLNLSSHETQSGKREKLYYSGGVGFTMEHAKLIQAFVNKVLQYNNDIVFVIHCAQGASRSAAIGEYCVRKISELKYQNWEDNMETYFDEHWRDNDKTQHQFRIGYRSKGPKYPHKNSLAGLGSLEGWNAEGHTNKNTGKYEFGEPDWMKDFQTKYSDKQGWINPRKK